MVLAEYAAYQTSMDVFQALFFVLQGVLCVCHRLYNIKTLFSIVQARFKGIQEYLQMKRNFTEVDRTWLKP